MAWDLKVGQKVVYVKTRPKNASLWGFGNETFPVVGQTYTIRNFTNSRVNPNEVYVRVEEIINPINPYLDRSEPSEIAFPSYFFRPLEKTSNKEKSKNTIKKYFGDYLKPKAKPQIKEVGTIE